MRFSAMEVKAIGNNRTSHTIIMLLARVTQRRSDPPPSKSEVLRRRQCLKMLIGPEGAHGF
jgi:hypothetical protein